MPITRPMGINSIAAGTAGIQQAMSAFSGAAAQVASASTPPAPDTAATSGPPPSVATAQSSPQSSLVEAQAAVLGAHAALQVNVSTIQTAHAAYAQSINILSGG